MAFEHVQPLVVGSYAPAGLLPTQTTHLADRLVLPGDYPDPTVVWYQGYYYMTATTAEWAPVFPLYRSVDMMDWEHAGAVFAAAPAWAVSNFWAPELSVEHGRLLCCYTARNQAGILAVALASTDNPGEGFTDHGPLIAQPQGSIDGVVTRDEYGQLYLIWKEDGNAFHNPTPIWAQPLREDFSELYGPMQEIMRNDKKWEGCLVEGPSIVRHEGMFYMFFAGNGCCGSCCTYATGVARAESLLGPWEKHPQNPILKKSEHWKCPGHGTAITVGNRHFLMHHAYHTDSHEYVGRQPLLSEYVFGPDGWPTFLTGRPGANGPSPALDHQHDDFMAPGLDAGWHWPVHSKQRVEQLYGSLYLSGAETGVGAVLARRTVCADYQAQTLLPIQGRAWAGLAAIGDPSHALAVMTRKRLVQLVRVQNGVSTVLAQAELPPRTTMLYLRLECVHGFLYNFSYRPYDTDEWTKLRAGDSSRPVNGTYLPPWDRGVRVGLTSFGDREQEAVFRSFSLQSMALEVGIES